MQVAEEKPLAKNYDTTLVRWVWQYIRPYQGLFWLATILMPLDTAFLLAQPYVIKLTVDEFLSGAHGAPPPAWLAMLLAAVILLILARSSDRLLLPLVQKASERLHPQARWGWAQALLRPVRTILAIAVFRIVMEVIRPAAVARVYIGRLLELMIMWSIAWCAVRIVDLLLTRVESRMAMRRLMKSSSWTRRLRRFSFSMWRYSRREKRW